MNQSTTSTPLRGLAWCLLYLLATGCTQTPASEADAPDSPAAQSPTQSSDATHHESEDLPLPKRLAFMSGHVEAGLALYRAGEPAMAAKHLLHPVSETHAAEREGLDALGFDGAAFETVSDALDAGQPASEIEPQLAVAESNLAMLAGKAGGEPKEIISYLMDVVVEEYQIGVPDSSITDAGEYQDAYGFTKVAIQRAAALEGTAADSMRSALQALLDLWPNGPVPVDDPTPFAEIAQQVSAVRTALDSL